LTGGSLFGLFGKRTNQYGRDPIIILGYVVHMISFYLIYINLPNDSPLDPDDSPTYFIPSK